MSEETKRIEDVLVDGVKALEVSEVPVVLPPVELEPSKCLVRLCTIVVRLFVQLV